MPIYINKAIYNLILDLLYTEPALKSISIIVRLSAI